MTRYDRKTWLVAAGLSGLAGFVDAIGFIQLGGFFVSFMSGNSTRLGVGLAGNAAAAWSAAGLIAAFVIGVVGGTLTGRAFRARERSVITLVALLLAVAASVAGVGHGTAAAAFVAMAMGAENTVFERDGDVSIGLTYMTGTLVKFGQRATTALLGGDRLAWLPYLLLWMGLVSGAVAGAWAYTHLGLASLWIGALAAAAFAFAPLKSLR